MASSLAADREAAFKNITLAIVHSLPSEILCLVFEELAHIAPIVDSTPTSIGRLGWLVATHVCYSWRIAAINHKTLWSCITSTHPEIFTMFVARAERRPLSVSGEPSADYTECETYFDALLEQLSCIKNLNIIADDVSEDGSGLPGRLLDVFNEVQDTLSLETLSLYFPAPWTYWLTENIFKHAPNLCDVFLRHVDFPPSVNHAGLRSLHIRGGSIDTTMGRVYAILRGLRNLESVVLDDAWDPESIEEPYKYTGPIVTLPQLRTLILKHEFASSARLLEHLQMHQQAYVQLEFSQIVNYVPWDNGIVQEFLRLHFERHPIPATVSVRVNQSLHTDPSGLAFLKVDASFLDKQAMTEIHLPTRTLRVAPGFRIDAKIRDDATPIDPSFRLLSCPTFCPASWTSITLHGSFSWSSQNFVDTFSSAVNVRFISLQNVSWEIVHRLVAQLSPGPVRERNPDLPIPILFPQLHRIELDGIVFDCPHKACQGSSSTTKTIQSTLQNRHAAGYPIRHIHIRNCVGVGESVHVEGWSEGYGCEVRWDGRGRDGHGHEHDQVVERLEGLVVS